MQKKSAFQFQLFKIIIDLGMSLSIKDCAFLDLYVASSSVYPQNKLPVVCPWYRLFSIAGHFIYTTTAVTSTSLTGRQEKSELVHKGDLAGGLLQIQEWQTPD